MKKLKLILSLLLCFTITISFTGTISFFSGLFGGSGASADSTTTTKPPEETTTVPPAEDPGEPEEPEDPGDPGDPEGVDLSTLSVSCLGDQFTTEYASLLRQQNVFKSVASNAADGSTMCPNGSQPFMERYLSLSADSDVILVMGGFNDAQNLGSVLGSKGDDPTTFYGAVDFLCDQLQSSFPDALIIFITPLAMSDQIPVDGFPVEFAAQAIREVCADRNIPVFDAYTETVYTGEMIVPESAFWQNTFIPQLVEFIEGCYQ